MRKTIEQMKAERASHVYARWAGATAVQYEGNPYHDYFRALPYSALKCLLDANHVTLNQKSVLVSSCGSGADIHYLRKHYDPVFTVSDLSREAVEIAMRLTVVS